MEIPDLFLVLNMISHSFAALTREISRSTLEINLVFPRTHVLFSILYILLYLLEGLIREGYNFVLHLYTVEYKKFRNTVKFAKATNDSDYLKRSFCYSGAVLWNSHPQDIRKLQSFAQFRKAIAEYY